MTEERPETQQAATPAAQDLAQRQQRAATDIEQVVQRFRNDPAQWEELRRNLQAAQNDDERVNFLVEFATQEGALGQMTTLGPQGGQVAATPTVTTVTVTTVTTV